MADNSLTSKTVHGLGWSAIENITKLGITFIVSIVLARLLSPDEYGLIGILTIFISVFTAIVDSGFTNALIRKIDITDEDYSTVFYTNIVVSFVMALILFFSARPIAIFFEREELVPLTQVMSSILIINAFSIVHRARATKMLDFRIQTKITFFSSIFSGVVGITMAYAGYGVWALVGQQVSVNLLTTILFWTYSKWFPFKKFSSRSFQEMWAFGWKLLVSSLLDTTWKEIYQIVIGKCYSPVTLGLFTRAKQFSDLCSTNLTSVVQRVSFPVLSSIQDDPKRLKDAYRRVIKTTMFPTFVFMFGMASIAKPMILVLIGEQWIECVPMLQLICIYGALYPLHAINLNMLQVKGRSDLFLRLEIVKKIIAVVPILMGVFLNIYLMLIGTIIFNFVSYYLNAFYSGSLLNYSFKEQVMDIMPSFLIALVMSILLYSFSFIDVNPFLQLAIQLILGCAIVLVICEFIKLKEYIEIKGIIASMIKKQL